ncbi:MAG: nucleoside/nucleotide kinase family protein [Pseudoruegeria sp.]
MTKSLTSIDALTELVLRTPRVGRRRLVAFAGPPASGKSTMAEALARGLCDAGCMAVAVPMDGFHLHNPFLEEKGLLFRKGSPNTFDVNGFSHLMRRLKDEETVYYPLFDRTQELSIAGAGCVRSDCDTVIVEGNYLLYEGDGWRSVADHWDLAVRLQVPIETLKARLRKRWLDLGFTMEKAEERIEGNDLINGRLIEKNALPADVIFEQE